MTIRLQLDRIPPGAEIGPQRHGVETVVFVASGEIVYQYGDALERRTIVRAGDVLYEAPAEHHLVRNEGTADALALLATADPDPRRVRDLLRRWDSVAEPVRRAAEAVDAGPGTVGRRLLVRPGDFGSATFSVSEVEIPAGGVHPWHRHPAAEHALVVLAGRGIVQVGQIEETLEPLTGIRIEPGLPHRIENTGRTPLRLYVCASPGTNPVIDRAEAQEPRRRFQA